MNKFEIKQIIFGVFLTFFCAVVLFFSYFTANYPIKYRATIKKYANEYSLSENLIFSVINVESGFNKDCVSKANAKGLMQLLDSTSSEIANKLNVADYNIFDPKINIKFGCYYLRYLIDYYGGNVNNALCAYNAGLNNVNGWLQDDEITQDGVTLISIPFKETSKYLNRIQSNQKIYKLIYSIK